MSENRKKLLEAEINEKLKLLPGWTRTGGKLHRDYQFRDFIEAFGFLTSAAIVVQSLDHHPEWFNVYNKVSVDLVTHDAGGITAMDFELAGRLEELAQTNPVLRNLPSSVELEVTDEGLRVEMLEKEEGLFFASISALEVDGQWLFSRKSIDKWRRQLESKGH